MPTGELTIPQVVVGSLITLYMLALVLRWVGAWIELDLDAGRLRFIPRLTDPLINLMRRVLPPMGPLDWGPVAAIMVTWIVRILLAGY